MSPNDAPASNNSSLATVAGPRQDLAFESFIIHRDLDFAELRLPKIADESAVVSPKPAAYHLPTWLLRGVNVEGTVLAATVSNLLSKAPTRQVLFAARTGFRLGHSGRWPSLDIRWDLDSLRNTRQKTEQNMSTE